MTSQPQLLTVTDLSLSLGAQQILSHFQLELGAGEIVALLGQSGSGKTSLLRVVAGLQTAQQGVIHFDQQPLSDGEISYVPTKSRQIGMVFQDYALFPHMTIADNIGFGLTRSHSSEKQRKITGLLDLVQLPQTVTQKYPHELSGGQQQRVALARALAPNPKLVLLDEPFSSLDTETRYQLVADMKRVFKQQGVSAILVTHDPKEADLLADKVGYLTDGRVQQWQIMNS